MSAQLPPRKPPAAQGTDTEGRERTLQGTCQEADLSGINTPYLYGGARCTEGRLGADMMAAGAREHWRP